MSRFKTGDLVRYSRVREAAATTPKRWPPFRDGSVGLILREANLKEDFAAVGNWTATVMYYVVWNDTEQPQLIQDWNLELVPEGVDEQI